jgi:threonine aldolase
MRRKIMSGSKFNFASDNVSGICPEAMEYLNRANSGYEKSYGDDEWTRRAADAIREVFEKDCEVFFVFNGTAANSVALASLCQSYHGVVCHSLAHIENDECGGPEFFSNGSKLLMAGGANGKLTPEDIEAVACRRKDIHYPRVKVISLSQATEVGTAYTKVELEAIGEVAKRHSMNLHMDGARFSNAAAFLGVKPREITWECGVDVLCFGGIKNGLAVGEAVFFDSQGAGIRLPVQAVGPAGFQDEVHPAPWVAPKTRPGCATPGMPTPAPELAEGLRAIPGLKFHPRPTRFLSRCRRWA